MPQDASFGILVYAKVACTSRLAQWVAQMRLQALQLDPNSLDFLNVGSGLTHMIRLVGWLKRVFSTKLWGLCGGTALNVLTRCIGWQYYA